MRTYVLHNHAGMYTSIGEVQARNTTRSFISAYIPYPLVYGAVMDNSCLVWERTCQTRGNCWLYDLDKLRYSYFGTSIAYLGVTLVLATGVSVFASDIVDFYGDSYEEVAREDDHEPPARNGKYRRLSSEDIDGPDERRFTM